MSDNLLIQREYTSARRIAGPLLFVEGASDLPYGAIVEITTGEDESGPMRGRGGRPTRSGQVIEVSEEYAAIQVFE